MVPADGRWAHFIAGRAELPRLTHARADHVNTPACRSVKAAVIDELVARRLLAALAPEEGALALAAADEVDDRRTRSTGAVQRARCYDAVRAERAFHACEPENPARRAEPGDPVGTETQRAPRGGGRLAEPA